MYSGGVVTTYQMDITAYTPYNPISFPGEPQMLEHWGITLSINGGVDINVTHGTGNVNTLQWTLTIPITATTPDDAQLRWTGNLEIVGTGESYSDMNVSTSSSAYFTKAGTSAGQRGFYFNTPWPDLSQVKVNVGTPTITPSTITVYDHSGN
jgi:hypothetical protein